MVEVVKEEIGPPVVMETLILPNKMINQVTMVVVVREEISPPVITEPLILPNMMINRVAMVEARTKVVITAAEEEEVMVEMEEIKEEISPPAIMEPLILPNMVINRVPVVEAGTKVVTIAEEVVVVVDRTTLEMGRTAQMEEEDRPGEPRTAIPEEVMMAAEVQVPTNTNLPSKTALEVVAITGEAMEGTTTTKVVETITKTEEMTII